jgi:hypothetical protein
MSEENVRYSIDGDEAHGGDHDRGHAPAQTSETARLKVALANRADAYNELREVRITNADAALRNCDAQSEAEQAAATRALENGDWTDHSRRQKNIAQIENQRSRAEVERDYWQSQPLHPADPVEAFIASRDVNTQAWLRAHPTDALVLATGSDPHRASKLNAADLDAVAEGHTRGSDHYFSHVDKFLGGKATGGGENAPKRIVHVVAKGKQAHGPDEMTKGEYRAATEDITWGYEGGAKRGQPIGVAEYLRRRNEMRKTPGWFDRED